MSNPFLDRLSRGPILGDGALGTMLHARGASLEQCLEELNLTRPDWVREIHLGYIRAGAEVIQTNTFAANRLRLADANLAEKARDINFRGVKLAREAREISGQAVWIAGSVGPLGRRAHGSNGLREELAADAFREQIAVLWEAGADLLILETFSDLNELAVAVRVARETTDLPVVAEVTFGNDGITVSGATPAEVAHALAALGVDVAGVNCSVGPARVLEFVGEMHRAEPALRLSAMPNAGFPFRSGERMIYASSPGYFTEHVPLFLDSGVSLIGGCCGTTPAHIQAMRAAVNDIAGRTAHDRQPRAGARADGARVVAGDDRGRRKPRRSRRHSCRSCAPASSWSAWRSIRRAGSARPRCWKARGSRVNAARTRSTWPIARWRACAWARWRSAC